jgi:hypothetical protein
VSCSSSCPTNRQTTIDKSDTWQPETCRFLGIEEGEHKRCRVLLTAMITFQLAHSAGKAQRRGSDVGGASPILK